MRLPSPRRARAAGGFTLVEVMIAFGILAVGVLGLAFLQIKAIGFGRSGRHTSQAALIARSEIEELERKPWASIAPTGGWTAGVARNSTVQAPDGTVAEQAYSVSWRIADLIADRVRSIDVRVSWDEPNRAGRSLAISTQRRNDS